MPSPPVEADTLTTLSGIGDGMLAGQFRAVHFLGAGPDGTAIAAKRLDGGDEVELRFVQEHAQSDALLERWARYQLVNHPSIISLQQVENAGAEWCAVLDTPRLPTLEEQLTTPWAADQGLKLLQQLASALAAAHELGLWHGCLAAATIRIDASTRPQIEFTGVPIWTNPASSAALLPDWQDADIADDVLGLALIAHQLLEQAQPVLAELTWVPQALDPDPARRPSAADVKRALSKIREQRTVQRLALESLNTEPPAASLAVTLPITPSRRRVGRFELDQLLGEGGMGKVYRALDLATGQVVALKLLRDDLLADENVQYRFRKEARVLKAVRSPYIANLVEADVTAEYAYIALEFVDGEDLASAFDARGEALEEPVALQIVADMARALVEPHRRGIVHRDIKPQNVLLTGDLSEPQSLGVKLCDFGIASARLTPETIGMTQDGLLGTPQYMSPEQCTSGAITPATDIYALGLTLYELLSGAPPFAGTDLMQILRMHTLAEPKKLSDCAAVSDGTAALVARALLKDPQARFADATEFLEALEAVRDGHGTALAVAEPERSTKPPYVIHFTLDLTSAPQDLWPYVSNTDQMNAVVGLPPVEVERLRQDGTTLTFLSNRVLGMQLRWEERPFEWVEGQTWSVYRRFSSGLMKWYSVHLGLAPLPSGGTRLAYRMEFRPLFAWLAWAVKFEVGVQQKGKLVPMFRRVDALIGDGVIRKTPSPYAQPPKAGTALTRRVAAKLEPLRAAGVDSSVLNALAQHVLAGADAEIARLRPLRFARSRGLDERKFTEACLLAAQTGLFTILWDVLCPLCQVPATFAESLERLEHHAECPACELSFPLKFAESVELVFRVAPDVRPNEVQVYCIGGPANSPHVAAQVCLGPGEGRVLRLALSEGRHRIRSQQLPGVIELDVRKEHAFSRADLVIGKRLDTATHSDEMQEDARLLLRAVDGGVQLSSGQQTVALRNELPREVVLRVERTNDKSDALTAARAWAMPKFRELFPGQTLESGRLAALGELSFLVVRVVDHLSLLERKGDAQALNDTVHAIDQLQGAANAHHGSLASVTMDVTVATFERSADALQASLALHKQFAGAGLCSLALHRGAAVTTMIDDRMTYYGKTLVQTLDLSATLKAGELAITAPAIGDELTRVDASPAPHLIEPAPMLGASAWLMRFAAAHALPTPSRASRDGESSPAPDALAQTQVSGA